MEKLIKKIGLRLRIVSIEEQKLDLSSMILLDTPEMSKDEYEQLQIEITESKIEKPKWEIYCWSDLSGFEYWSDPKNGQNYIQITGIILDMNLSDQEIEALKRDFLKMYDKFL